MSSKSCAWSPSATAVTSTDAANGNDRSAAALDLAEGDTLAGESSCWRLRSKSAPCLYRSPAQEPRPGRVSRRARISVLADVGAYRPHLVTHDRDATGALCWDVCGWEGSLGASGDGVNRRRARSDGQPNGVGEKAIWIASALSLARIRPEVGSIRSTPPFGFSLAAHRLPSPNQMSEAPMLLELMTDKLTALRR
jgi:hypothetical protein